MSSFIGHSVTGTVIYLYSGNSLSENRTWLFWLILMAIFPDIEYGFLWLFGAESDIRLTHSLVFCSILPVFTTVYFNFKSSDEENKTRGIQAFAAAYSHLVLDLLVGVSSFPLLWPFTDHLFKLPFGILPSAGHIDLANRYLYRNLIIELGILLPVCSFILMKGRIRKSEKCLLAVLLHVIVFIPFFIWGIILDR